MTPLTPPGASTPSSTTAVTPTETPNALDVFSALTTPPAKVDSTPSTQSYAQKIFSTAWEGMSTFHQTVNEPILDKFDSKLVGGTIAGLIDATIVVVGLGAAGVGISFCVAFGALLGVGYLGQGLGKVGYLAAEFGLDKSLDIGKWASKNIGFGLMLASIGATRFLQTPAHFINAVSSFFTDKGLITPLGLRWQQTFLHAGGYISAFFLGNIAYLSLRLGGVGGEKAENEWDKAIGGWSNLAFQEGMANSATEFEAAYEQTLARANQSLEALKKDRTTLITDLKQRTENTEWGNNPDATQASKEAKIFQGFDNAAHSFLDLFRKEKTTLNDSQSLDVFFGKHAIGLGGAWSKLRLGRIEKAIAKEQAAIAALETEHLKLKTDKTLGLIRDDIYKLSRQAETLKDEITKTEEELANKNGKLAKTKLNSSHYSSHYSSLQRQITTLNNNLTNKRAKLTSLQTTLSELHTQYKDTQTSLEAEIKQVQKVSQKCAQEARQAERKTQLLEEMLACANQTAARSCRNKQITSTSDTSDIRTAIQKELDKRFPSTDSDIDLQNAKTETIDRVMVLIEHAELRQAYNRFGSVLEPQYQAQRKLRPTEDLNEFQQNFEETIRTIIQIQNYPQPFPDMLYDQLTTFFSSSNCENIEQEIKKLPATDTATTTTDTATATTETPEFSPTAIITQMLTQLTTNCTTREKAENTSAIVNQWSDDLIQNMATQAQSSENKAEILSQLIILQQTLTRQLEEKKMKDPLSSIPKGITILNNLINTITADRPDIITTMLTQLTAHCTDRDKAIETSQKVFQWSDDLIAKITAEASNIDDNTILQDLLTLQEKIRSYRTNWECGANATWNTYPINAGINKLYTTITQIKQTLTPENYEKFTNNSL